MKTCLIALLLTSLTGCYRALDPSGYHYVYDIGGAEDIAEWGLEQTQEQHIRAAIFGLTGLSQPDSKLTRDEGKRHQAIEGLIRIHEKLMRGWPGFEPDYGPWTTAGDRAKISRDERLKDILLGNYWVIASRATDDPLFHDAFFRIRPPPDREDLLEYWEAQKQRRGLEEPAGGG